MSISKMPFDVCCSGDIGTCKTLPIRRWEIFGCLAKFPRTNCNGGSRMMQFDGFRIYDVLCKSACHQLDAGKLQFYFGSSNNKLDSLDERFSLAIMCMNMRYLMM